jgi:hypothetical protein
LDRSLVLDRVESLMATLYKSKSITRIDHFIKIDQLTLT